MLFLRHLLCTNLKEKKKSGNKTGNHFKTLERIVVSPHCLSGIFTQTMQNTEGTV